MAKQNKKPTTVVNDSLNSFISALSNNIGFSLDNEKKKTFNPFSVENTDYIMNLFMLMTIYSKTKKKPILVPDEVVLLPKGEKKVKFLFKKKELDIDTISNIIEKEQLNQVIIDEDNSIEIIKKSKAK